MEVMIPPSPGDFNFNFDSASTSPFISAPGSPQPFGNPLFFSAPASPTRISAFYRDFDEFYAAAADGCDSPSSIPFKWEEKPGIPKKRDSTSNGVDDDFEFDFSGQLETISVSAADELFDGGKIKPLKLPPRLHSNELVTTDSPKSPIRKNIFIEALSPKHRNKDLVDPFAAAAAAAAIEETRKIEPEKQETQRGREEKKCNTSSSSSSSNVRRKGSRSLSPFRVFDIFSDHEDAANNDPTTKEQQPSSLISKWGWKGWKLKDLLLFRSASEGRATYKSPMMKKYEVMKKAALEEDAKNSSFRSTESSGSVSRGRGRRRGPPASAHEIHYTVNRAASEEMKRRTSLPYRHGLMGCLGFNPVLRDQISRRIESLTRGR